MPSLATDQSGDHTGASWDQWQSPLYRENEPDMKATEIFAGLYRLEFMSQCTQGRPKGHQSSNGLQPGPIPLVKGQRVHRYFSAEARRVSEMEVGVGRGLHKGQCRANCMLGVQLDL
ncbi:uncharacterized protein ACB058_013049 isoform 2-T3 [Synchiropus picturatus]